MDLVGQRIKTVDACRRAAAPEDQAASRWLMIGIKLADQGFSHPVEICDDEHKADPDDICRFREGCSEPVTIVFRRISLLHYFLKRRIVPRDVTNESNASFFSYVRLRFRPRINLYGT